MKKFNISTLALSLLILFVLGFRSQRVFSQSISERYDKLIISENFDSSSAVWTTMANAENLFIIQDGEYILQRKSSAAPFAILANFKEEPFNDFRVITSIKIDKIMSDDAFAGLLFMMQPQGQGGFLVEINKNKEYRLRQIVNGAYKYLSGSSKSSGWTKNSYLNDAGTSNLVEIRNQNRNYDLYLNNHFVQSFSEPAYKSGQMGIIIGPASRAKIDYVYVFTGISASDAIVATTNHASETSDKPTTSSSDDIIELAESIIKLKTQINKLNEENEDLRKTISAMQSGDQEQDVTLKNYEKQVKSLQTQVIQHENSIDSLRKINTELLKYKELAGGNENADLIIVLSKALKAEKEKNAVLEDEINQLKTKTPADKPGPKGSTKTTKPDSVITTKKQDAKKEPDILKLPEDN